MKKFLSLFGLLSLLIWFAPDASAQTYTLDQVLAKMNEVGKAFQSMTAALEKTKVTVIVDDHYTEFGTIYVARRGKDTQIKIDISKPEKQSLLMKGGKAILYFPKLKQAQEFVLGQNQGKAESALLVGFGQSSDGIKNFYNAALLGEETIDGKKTSILELKPKDPKAAAQFTSVRLWMDQSRWIPVQTRTTEGSGDYMVMKFTNVKTNSRIANSVFDLKLPKDVQIVK
jgi:outer membrane lipoprotein-sorting protein